MGSGEALGNETDDTSPHKISQWKALDCPDFLPPGRAESNYPAFYILLLPGGPQTCQAPDPFFEEEAHHNPR